MSLTPVLVFSCLVVAVLLGRALGGRLGEQHLTPDTRDTIKLSLGLVATLSALLLGLLVSSAKGAYDLQLRQVDEMAAKVTTLDRVLTLYGPESGTARRELRATVENAIARAWPQQTGATSDLTPDLYSGDDFYRAVHQLVPNDAIHTELKGEATRLALDLAEGRALLVSRALTGVSTPLLMIVVSWLVLILFGFSLLAPRNLVATLSLTFAAAAVSGAILLMLEFYSPFDGMIRISSDAMTAAISRIPN